MRVLFLILLLANLALAGAAYWATSHVPAPPRAELNPAKAKLLDPNRSDPVIPADVKDPSEAQRQ